MGIVLSARHIQLDDRVAIKLLLPEMLSEPGVPERFLQEAKVVRQIKSEHVARVMDVGTFETGTPYIIMEYLEGKDLAKIRGERGALEIEEVVDYIIQACDAIAEAHSHGIVHRDLKPANLFLTRRPDGSPLIKVLDFGTAKLPPSEAAAGLEMTQTGMAIGSPSYMAPEQMLSSRDLDARADIWAIGVILYNLLTGSFPFKADTLLQMCAAVIQSPPIPPSTHRGDLPQGLEDVILKCLEKKAEDRFPDVAALSRGLLPFAASRAHYLVERIERVLGVTSDLATFLAPSMRNPPVTRINVDIPISLVPTDFASRSGARPESAVISKSLTTSSLATVVRSGESSDTLPNGAGRPAGSRRKKFLVGAGAAFSICAGLLFVMLASPSPTHGAAGQPVRSSDKMDEQAPAVRPLETPIAIRTPTAVAQAEPLEVTAGGEAGVPSLPANAEQKIAEPPIDRGASSGARLASGQDRRVKERNGAPAGGQQPTVMAEPKPTAAPSSPTRAQEPSIVIPDDR